MPQISLGERAQLACTAAEAHIRRSEHLPATPMRNILKLLNDLSGGDLAELTDEELQSSEARCERWRTHAEAERARRKSLPRAQADPGEIS